MAFRAGPGLWSSVSGAPTAAGIFPASITLCNASGGCLTVPVTITINVPGAAALAASYANASGQVGAAFSAAPAVQSGGPVQEASLLTGSLPPGLTLNADGSITGTPATSGEFSLAVKLANASGGTTDASLMITINPLGLSVFLCQPVDVHRRDRHRPPGLEPRQCDPGGGHLLRRHGRDLPLGARPDPAPAPSRGLRPFPESTASPSRPPTGPGHPPRA